MSDYKNKRIDYINNWPNMPKFEIELRYEEKYKSTNNGIPFSPFCMSSDNNEFYNKAISFMIDAIESLCNKPNHSFNFMFTAFDIYSKYITSIDRITDRIWSLTPIWSSLINGNADLKDSFIKLISKMPNKSLQYLFTQLHDTRVYNRLTSRISHSSISNVINEIITKYSNNYNDYAVGIRQGSRLLFHILNEDNVTISGINHSISLEEKIHLLVSGFLYSLRNDSYHGSSISCTKSSLCNMSTMANSYYSFMLTYYLLLFLIIDNTRSDKQNAFSSLALNIKSNIDQYTCLFGNHISK